MSKDKILDMNFDLAARFNCYLIKHPELIDGLPEKSALVFLSGTSKKLDAHNIKLGKRIRTKERSKVFTASLTRNHRWTVEPLAA